MNNRYAAAFVASALVGTLATTGCSSTRPPPPAVGQVAPAADPLIRLNQGFRAAYRDARARTLAGVRPVILLQGSTATLLSERGRVDVDVDPPVYHSLKAVAHIPLAIYVMLAHVEGPIEAGTIQTLSGFRELIAAARASLAARDELAAERSRQETIVRESLDYLDSVLQSRSVRRDDLTAFARRLAPLVMANVADAARAQLARLHATVTGWREHLSREEWDRLRVVIVGSHMPRESEATTQYFSRLLGEPVEGRRIVYAESLWDEARALDLLGTHVLDSDIGEAFFGEAMRMHRDVLSDAARDYLPTLLPEDHRSRR